MQMSMPAQLHCHSSTWRQIHLSHLRLFDQFAKLLSLQQCFGIFALWCKAGFVKIPAAMRLINMSFQSYLKVIKKTLTFGLLKANDRAKLAASGNLRASTCCCFVKS